MRFYHFAMRWDEKRDFDSILSTRVSILSPRMYLFLFPEGTQHSLASCFLPAWTSPRHPDDEPRPKLCHAFIGKSHRYLHQADHTAQPSCPPRSRASHLSTRLVPVLVDVPLDPQGDVEGSRSRVSRHPPRFVLDFWTLPAWPCLAGKFACRTDPTHGSHQEVRGQRSESVLLTKFIPTSAQQSAEGQLVDRQNAMRDMKAVRV